MPEKREVCRFVATHVSVPRATGLLPLFVPLSCFIAEQEQLESGCLSRAARKHLRTYIDEATGESLAFAPPRPRPVCSGFPIVRGRSGRIQMECLETRQLLSVASVATNPVATPSSLIATPAATPAVPTGLTPSQVRDAYGLNQIGFEGGKVAGNGEGRRLPS